MTRTTLRLTRYRFGPATAHASLAARRLPVMHGSKLGRVRWATSAVAALAGLLVAAGAVWVPAIEASSPVVVAAADTATPPPPPPPPSFPTPPPTPAPTAGGAPAATARPAPRPSTRAVVPPRIPTTQPPSSPTPASTPAPTPVPTQPAPTPSALPTLPPITGGSSDGPQGGGGAPAWLVLLAVALGAANAVLLYAVIRPRRRGAEGV